MSVPDSLQFLKPFIRLLKSLPAEDLNEDVDTELLDELLRDRVAGMSAERADAEIYTIRDSVNAWIADSATENLCAEWLLGYLLYPDLGRELLRPPQPVEKGPRIRFNTPEGWTETRVPFRLDLTTGTLNASITVVDEFVYTLIPKQNEHWVAPPHVQAIRTESEVLLECCHGKKYVYVEQSAKNWKRVDYVLAVPGGFVTIWIGTDSGEDFDESPIEDRLDTLSLENVA